METYDSLVLGIENLFEAMKVCCARGRPIIVEWERDARHSAGLSRSVTHRYVTERYTFQSDSQPQPNLRRCHVKIECVVCRHFTGIQDEPNYEPLPELPVKSETALEFCESEPVVYCGQ
ncbi:hypothetical protein EVAR_68261_1 [Eumeta japonica]|uniref:Uncharacterized protein n=1 Tax=Eumeta variegata TaxID=151549 RepID=A0A4C1ZUX6_EUMVA|nr:hypothetical protein EVAR_68261_1 [Eumeta japonica]